MDTYCKDWMQKEEGVSTTNSDDPPSLYAPSVALSDSLLNETSVSCNHALVTVSVPKITKMSQKGRGIQITKDYSNTVFM